MYTENSAFLDQNLQTALNVTSEMKYTRKETRQEAPDLVEWTTVSCYPPWVWRTLNEGIDFKCLELLRVFFGSRQNRKYFWKQGKGEGMIT